MADTPNFGLPKPDEEANVDEEFFRLQEAWDILDVILLTFQAGIAGKANLGHLHGIGDVSGLAAALAAKMDVSRTFALDDLTDVQGAIDAAVNYVLVKTASGQWQPSSAIAALGPHGHPVSDIAGLSDALASLVTNRLRFDAAQDLTAVQKAQAKANIGADDPWAFQPIGVPIPLFTHVTGVSLPPTDRGYRYAYLAAGQAGVGAYNEGVLSSESVSGSAPLILATAVVNYALSPIYGQTVRLLNTEGRFVRAGVVSGTLQDSDNLSHTHEADPPQATTSSDTHSHTVSSVFIDSGSSKFIGSSSNNASSGTRSTSSDTHNHTVDIPAFTTGPAGGTEARPRNIAANYVMRIF